MTLKVDEIQNTSGGAVTLTKQSAAKVLFAMNLRSVSTLGTAANGVSADSLNVSSGTDSGTGLARANLTNSFSDTQFVWSEGCMAANNTMNLDVGVTTTSLLPFQQHDADSSSDVDTMGCGIAFGELA